VAAEAWEAVCAAYESAREAYDAEEPPCPPDLPPAEHWEQLWPLREKHGVNRMYDALKPTHERTYDIRQNILKQPAEGLFGIGVKLAAMELEYPAVQDFEDTIRSVLGDIDRMIGTDFLARFSVQED
jgi:hypothetical protein